MASMGGTVQCTYKDCFQRFSTERQMKRHKEQDPDHFFCKRCNVDCEDDGQYMIHQLQSSKHIACPLCGAEFEGTSARDLHVRVRHAKKQTLSCVGCGTKVVGASAYMEHIANGKCKVISQGQFNQALAERQVEKDLDTAQPEPVRLSRSLALDTDHQSGLSLIGAVAVTSQHADVSHQQGPYDLMSSMLDLSISKYPPLEAQGASSDGLNVGSNARADGSNNAHDGELLNSKAGKSTPQGPGFSSTLWSHDLFADSTEEAKPRDGGVLLSDGFNVSKANGTSDPNMPFTTVTKTIATPKLSSLDPMRYYNDVCGRFECPSKDCMRTYESAEAFKAHFASGAHCDSKKSQCPGCLKKFPTLWALIAHCESPSQKCRIRKSARYNEILQDLTASLLATDGHLEDSGEARYVANATSNKE